MNLNLDFLQEELQQIQTRKNQIEEERNSAYNQEYFYSLTDELKYIKVKEAKFKDILTTLLLLRNPEIDFTPTTYIQLILQRLSNIDAYVLIIEDQQNMGHNEEHGLQMECELTQLQREKTSLGCELNDVISTMAVDPDEEDQLCTHIRTLSIARGDAGELQRDCMHEASKMSALLYDSLQKGQLSPDKYAEKNRAINHRIQFFRASTSDMFKSQLVESVLPKP